MPSPHHTILLAHPPNHNLTLTRTVKEIVELDRKLRESYPGVRVPEFPVGMQLLPPPTPKRRSTFLNTLSRLASPSSAKTGRRGANASVSPSALPTPLTSPSGEINDPFSNFNATTPEPAPPVSPSVNSTGLASYLTTISNTVGLRNARVWKRFVRVRTDDLESVRVERAIKRVRSDLAAHLGGMAKEKENVHNVIIKADSIVVPSETGIVLEEQVNGSEAHKAVDQAQTIKEVDMASAEVNEPAPGLPSNTVTDDVPAETPPSTDLPDSDSGHPVGEVAGDEVELIPGPVEEVSTPVVAEVPARIPRSHSVDFDKSRMSRVFVNSTPSHDGTSSQTGDESSASTTGGSVSKRKKRSRSTMPKEPRKSQRKVVIDDFEMLRVLGKGCAGKVLLVRHKTTSDLYALKAITKRHVLAHQELQHTLTEQAVLKRMSAESKDPFVVKLWWSFHDKENLFLVMDFHPGGDLATQLARWGRLGRDRARFYAAEIVEGCEGLHAAGVIYRDLKPENILIGSDGHIVLTDFGLSKEFPRKANQTANSTPYGSREFYSSVPGSPQPATPPWMRIDAAGDLAIGWPGQAAGHADQTTTFCGTAEYLAPEVIQGLPYSFEVDWWSFGTMLYEMLTGITPFWANNHSDMYVRVLQDELQFPEDRALDQDTKSLIRGLLQRNPALRICEPRIKKHPYFSMIDWSHVYYKRYIPPYIPPIDPANAGDTQNFDDTFLDMEPVLDEYLDDQIDTDQEPEHPDTDRTDDESNTTPSQSRSSSIRPQHQTIPEDTVDVFDGYSFKGRHSLLLDDEDDEDSSGSQGDSEEGDENENEEIISIFEPIETTPLIGDVIPEDVNAEIQEPKTPEARPVVVSEVIHEDIFALSPKEIPLAPTPSEIEPSTVDTLEEPAESAEQFLPAGESKPVEEPRPEEPRPLEEPNLRKSKELPTPGPEETIPPTVPDKEVKEIKETKTKPTFLTKSAAVRGIAKLGGRSRREKSGVPALDRYLSDGGDETEVTEREEDEDDDWDFIDAVDGEDRNGAKGTSLFARGVVDRYKLAVFRIASTPSHQRSGPRSFSGMSKNSETNTSEPVDSPSPSQRRGRTPLNFRRHPGQFLRAKSPGVPPSTFSTKSSGTAKSFASASNSLSYTSSTGGLLTPSPSTSHSLKSKESVLSVGEQSLSSDQSGPGEGTVEAPGEMIRSKPLMGELEKQKNRKLKKYKENAEKVFSLFSSPRQQL
ncbi:hypothetical protein C0993_008936 [Termitomyces sp. T159_Od127]|nr:hypothetical protein C0993_008936 [Termitomyces sp. T159_Od127]